MYKLSYYRFGDLKVRIDKYQFNLLKYNLFFIYLLI